jgi:hypothetical protein
MEEAGRVEGWMDSVISGNNHVRMKAGRLKFENSRENSDSDVGVITTLLFTCTTT